ncbi:MAG TPA: TetR/AcrR family transcriptional regulator [Ramlibacter sp.]|jgi:AcrR family transcriptional regulator
MRPVLTDEEVAHSRAEVCRVAEGLFASHGVAGVTMRTIAAELGWSSTTAYRYFKSKEEILAAVRAAAFNRFCDVIEEATRSSTDPRKSARTVGQAYIGFAIGNPDAYRMMFDVSQADVTGNAELTDALARAHRAMIAYVTPLIAIGVLEGEAKAVGQMLWAAAHGLVMLRLSGIVASDTALRRLHEQTMSALASGTHQEAAAPSRARKTPADLPRRAARKTARSPPLQP